MPKIEREAGNLIPLVIIVKKPTIRELISIMQDHKDSQNRWVTLVGENSGGIYYEVVDPRIGNEILRRIEGEKLSTSVVMSGEVIVHRFSKV